MGALILLSLGNSMTIVLDYMEINLSKNIIEASLHIFWMTSLNFL